MTNWKTTLAGFAAGALNLFAQGVNWKQILVSIGLTALGTLAQDGGKPATPTK